jgi:hypothetical protein
MDIDVSSPSGASGAASGPVRSFGIVEASNERGAQGLLLGETARGSMQMRERHAMCVRRANIPRACRGVNEQQLHDTFHHLHLDQ